jgi:hypothetical protein
MGPNPENAIPFILKIPSILSILFPRRQVTSTGGYGLAQ